MSEPPAGNPFATRYTRPGALPYLFPAGSATSLASLADALESHHNWGQIFGPHGTGKSTLLAGLLEELERRGRRVVRIELHDGQRRLPIDLRGIEPPEQPTTIAVDGYEQLGCRARARLKGMCRRRRWGLVVTAHDDVGLPTLWQTQVDGPLAARVVQALLPPGAPAPDAEELAALVKTHGGDLRSVLFDLYDCFESRR